MRTPVALPRMKSSYHFDNLISDDSPNSHFGDLGVVVRGRFVRVGAGCVIDRVEYSEDLTVEDGGIVKEPVRC